MVPDDCPLHEQHAWQRARALYAYVIASAIFTVLIYSLLFQIHGNQVAGCERSNELRAEFNERAGAFDDILRVLIQARVGDDALRRGDGQTKANRRETLELVRARHAIDTVPVPDCETVYPKPWPFG